MSYQILTDTCCDFTQEMYQKLNLTALPLAVHNQGKISYPCTDAEAKALYASLRAGAKVTTSSVNPQAWETALTPILEGGQDVLILAFSSGLSATAANAFLAARNLAENYPGREVRVVDTLCASLGQGLLAYYACQKRDEGYTLSQLYDWCEDNKLHLCHWFTVDDLMYLKRGGRVSAATALAGTLLNIKPVLHMDDDGHLISVSKERGRKAAIRALAEKVGTTGIPGANDCIFISHGDCPEDAEYLASLLKEKYGTKEVYINYVGAVIGAHSGPGTLSVFFMGISR